MATLKQKRVVQKLTENPRMSVGQAMREAGYSEVTATRPSDVTRSKGFQELLAETLKNNGIDLDSAIKPIAKGLKAVKMNEFTGEVTEDLNTQLKASDRALRLMGINGADNQTNNFTLIINEQRQKYGI